MPSHQNTTRRRIAEAALRLAAKRAWADVTLADIARAAGKTLPQIENLFPDKTDFLPVMVGLTDDTMTEFADVDDDAPLHDRLFEIFMARFDALNRHRPAILSILAACETETGWLAPILKAQWTSMELVLKLAGKTSDTWQGTLHTAGLLALYNLTLRVWLNDDTPDMTKTMAFLDRALRRALFFDRSQDMGKD